MPLTVNVGLSRKSSENYQSQGLSINITAELDQSLLADPPRLQDEIDRIYSQAEDALERQAAANSQAPQPAAPSHPQQARGRTLLSASSGQGRVVNGSGRAARPNVRHQRNPPAAHGVAVEHGGPSRPATESQMRALHALAKRIGRPLEEILVETFGDSAADIRMASRLIDILKEQLGEQQTGSRP